MSEMVERVARVLARRCGVPPDETGGGTWDGGSFAAGSPAWTFWADDARAAIEAMREPTYEMLQRGHGENFGYYPTQAWKAMIDEALK